jgi:hypothetical protein
MSVRNLKDNKWVIRSRKSKDRQYDYAYPSELYLREGATCGAGTAYPSELYLRECPTCGAGTAYPSEFIPGCAALSLDLQV